MLAGAMSRRAYDLPPLTALAAFEAAARHASIKRAAAELNVTPGAVSRQVRALEEDLGCVLFTRVHRGIEPTEAGTQLAETLAAGFARTGDVCRRLRAQGQAPRLTVGATTAFAGFWLIPRIGGFWQRHPEITVDHAVSDEPPGLASGGVDLAFRYGHGEWPGLHAVRLFGDSLVPVCAPNFAAERGVLRLEDVPDLPRLGLRGVDPGWIDWDAWFAWTGLPPAGDSARRERGVNNYTVLIQAVRDGQGLGLGWRRLVQPLIDSGDLVTPIGAEMPAPGAHYLVRDAARQPSPAMRVFADWLTGEAASRELSATVYDDFPT
jgi:DNA-binding transcriptional LysR family regulator